mmetsp:Transcript_8626/g.9806  ORF Transcript_8626/g.9806 Transcript_8626/m.9806 type:complete len:167 (+) Transcript_8626:75-575(+)
MTLKIREGINPENETKHNDISHVQLLLAQLSRKSTERSQKVLERLSRNGAKSVACTTNRSSKETMSSRKINYSGISLKDVYKNLPITERLPSLKKEQDGVGLQEIKKDQISFPNSEIYMDMAIAKTKSGSLKYSLELKNIGEDEYQMFEEHLTSKIQEEVKNLVLK